MATAIVLAVSLSRKIGGLSAALLGGTAALLIMYSQSPEIFSVYVWPPSRSSAPVLLLISSAFAALTAYSFSAGKKSEDAQRFADQKRKLIAMQLTQAMRWDKDEEEGEEGAEKDKEGAEKKEEEGDEKEKEKEKKRPPESAELLAIFDDVEEVHVTNFGIAADDEAYAGVLALFKERVPIDLAEAGAARASRVVQTSSGGCRLRRRHQTGCALQRRRKAQGARRALEKNQEELWLARPRRQAPCGERDPHRD